MFKEPLSKRLSHISDEKREISKLERLFMISINGPLMAAFIPIMKVSSLPFKYMSPEFYKELNEGAKKVLSGYFKSAFTGDMKYLWESRLSS